MVCRFRGDMEGQREHIGWCSGAWQWPKGYRGTWKGCRWALEKGVWGTEGYRGALRRYQGVWRGLEGG